jgi:hypothetical protein
VFIVHTCKEEEEEEEEVAKKNPVLRSQIHYIQLVVKEPIFFTTKSLLSLS